MGPAYALSRLVDSRYKPSEEVSAQDHACVRVCMRVCACVCVRACWGLCVQTHAADAFTASAPTHFALHFMMHAQVLLQSDVAIRIVALLVDWRCGRDGRQSLLLDVARLVRPCVEARLSLLRAGILPVLVRLSAVIDPIRSALRSATGCDASRF